MKSLAIAAGLYVIAASPLHADVTIRSTVSGKGLGMGGGSESVQYIKGTKIRTETGDNISIIDAGTRQMIVLNPKKKEAEIWDVARLQADIQKATGGGEPKVQMTPTGQTKQILGRLCTQYDLAITVPMTMGNDTMQLTMSGPVWVAKGAPGSEDYTAFYTAAAEKGLFFGHPQQAKGAGAQMKTTTEMYRTIANIGGVPYQMDMQMKFEGSGMMAAMMNKMGGVSTSSVVTAVSTDPIGDDKFAVPPGWTTKNKQ